MMSTIVLTVLKIFILGFLFLGAVLREHVSKITEVPASVYWSLMGLTLGFGILVNIIECISKLTEKTRAKASDEAQQKLSSGSEYLLRNLNVEPSRTDLEQSVLYLRNAESKFKEAGDKGRYLIGTVTGLGLACEKLACFGAVSGEVLSAEGEKLTAVKVSGPDEISLKPSRRSPFELRVTAPENKEMWRLAREAYDRAYGYLFPKKKKKNTKAAHADTANIANNIGNFMLADYWLNRNTESLAKARKCFEFIVETMAQQAGADTERSARAKGKLRILERLIQGEITEPLLKV